MITSYGDKITPGYYQLYSRHNHVVNYCDGTRFVFMVSPEIGAGPLNIVLADFNPGTDGNLEISTSEIIWNQEVFPIPTDNFYHSQIPELSSKLTPQISKNLKWLKVNLIDLAPPRSLIFLLDGGKLENFKPGFETKFVQHIQQAVHHLFSGKMIEGISQIRGCGFGLTPSGDDFIAGMLIALHVLEKITSMNHQSLVRQIFEQAKSSNVLVNAFLELAFSGHISQQMSQLIQALMTNDRNEIETACKCVLTNGATSGADFATGFLITLEHYLLDHQSLS